MIMKTIRTLAAIFFCLWLSVSPAFLVNPCFCQYKTQAEFSAIPLITVLPDSVNAAIMNCGDSLTFPVTIYNYGDTVLQYTATWGGYEYTDGFENGMDQWVFDGYWSLTGDAYDGNYCVTAYPAPEYINNMNQYLQMKDSIIVFNQDSCYLTYKLRYAFQSIADRMLTYLQVNNGSWVLVNTVHGNQWDAGWMTRTVNLSPYVQNGDFIKIKYFFTTNASYVNYGVRMDNFKIYGAASQIPWLVISSGSGSIPAGDSATITCTLSSAGKISGLYQAQILISSNDTANPTVEVTVNLNIVGNPVVSLQSQGILFQPTSVNGQQKSLLKLKNEGCAPLVIDSITIHPPVFSTSGWPGVLAAWDSVSREVFFNPTDTIGYTGMVVIHTSAGTDSVALQGNGIPAPVIFAPPDTLLLILNGCEDTVSGSVVVHNNGLSDLHVSPALDAGESRTVKVAECEPYTKWWDYLDMQIFRVTLNGIDNITGVSTGNGYEDFSDSLTARLEAGASYPIYVQSGLIYNVNVKAWIDFNNDANFSQDELVFESINANTDHYGIITIPDKPLCFTPLRMRVMSEYVEYPLLPCQEVDYGECEDYKVILTNNFGVDPDSVSISPGDSSTVHVHFSAEHLVSGTYQAAVVLSSDDPVNPVLTIPLTLIENGVPQLTLSEDNLSFPVIMENTVAHDTILITNTGCDTLRIFSLSGSLAEFSATPAQANILPDASGEFIIHFSPTATGNYQDSLVISNNDQVLVIHVSGSASGSPSISLTADSLLYSIQGCHDSIADSLTLYNNGTVNLNYQVNEHAPFREDFEHGLNQWVYNGYWAIAPQTHGGSGALAQSLNAPEWQYYEQSIVMRDSVKVTQAETCLLSFWLKRDLEQDADYFFIELQVNGGPWEMLEWFNNSFDWELQTYDLSSYVSDGDTIKVMFGFYSNALTRQGILLDDIRLEGAGNKAGWLQVYPLSGTVIPGDSAVLSLTMSSQVVNAGNFKQLLLINSNDPLIPEIPLIINLQVTGNPELSLLDSLVQFPAIMQYTSASQSFVIRNHGCDTLIITEILSMNPDFQLPFSSLRVQPYDSVVFLIGFNPQQTGTYDEFIHLHTNIGDTVLHLSGFSSPAPLIAISQDTLPTSMQCEVTSTQNFFIKNTGGVVLEYALYQDIYWFGIMPSNGSLAPGDSSEITVTANKEGLATGTYDGHIWVSCNDPLNPNPTIVVRITVLNTYKPVNLGPDRQLCTGDTVVLHSGNAYSSYLWNVNSVDSTLLVTSSGEYYVQVIDSAGCLYSDSVQLAFNLRPLVELGEDISLCSAYAYSFSPVLENAPPGSSLTTQLGGGSSFTSDLGSTPFGTYTMDNRTQMLYSIGEMLAAGMAAGMISSIAFYVGNPGYPAMNNFSIKMGSCGLFALTEAVNGLSLVYATTAYQAVAGWNSFTLDQPFYWAGTQNLIVEVCFDNDTWSYSSSVQYTYVENSVWSGWCDNCAAGCNLTSGSVFSERANLRLNNDIDVSQYAWTGPSGYTSTSRSAQIPQVTFAHAGLYTLTVTNLYGCAGSDSITLSVNPSPVVDAGPDTTMVYGDPVTLNATVGGPPGPYMLQWSPTAGLSDPLITSPQANPLSTTSYVLQATAQNACTGSDTVVVNVEPIYYISGTLTYLNLQNTPMNDFGLALKNADGYIVDSLIVGDDGSFVFENLVNGSYRYQVSPVKAFGGVNATDALQVCKHFVYLINLTGLPLEAGDVNKSGNLTSADALLILRRTVGLQDTFPSGDWVFEDPIVNVNNANINCIIHALCYGDVNGSYVPAAKSGTVCKLETKDYLEIPDNLILEVPIQVSQTCTLGAVTLRLRCSQDIEQILDVGMPGEGMIWNVLPDHSLQVAWQNVEGISLQADGLLFTIKLRLKSKVLSDDPLFQLLEGSEFADPEARVLEFLGLTVPAVSLDKDESYLRVRLNPNPFKEETKIAYTLPEDGLIIISLLDYLGCKVMVLREEPTKAGSHNLTFGNSQLPPGLYTLHFIFIANGRTYQEAIKVIKSN